MLNFITTRQKVLKFEEKLTSIIGNTDKHVRHKIKFTFHHLL
jgi:hypothetical protein